MIDLRLLIAFGVVTVSLAGCEDKSLSDPPLDPENPFEAAEASPGSWTWLPVAETECRDGSSTGMGVRLQPGADSLVLFLQGGGACFDSLSCAENEESPVAGSNYAFDDFNNWVTALGSQGLFNIEHADNPVGTWHHVYIPYCTGDLHGGNNPDTAIDGTTHLQQFVGSRNVATFLSMLAPYFADSKRVLLAGSSAGGYGVLFNYDRVAASFASVSVTALVDAAPLIVHDGIDLSCFAETLGSTFDIPVPAWSEGGVAAVCSELAARHPTARFALATADADLISSIFLDRQSVGCGGDGVNAINFRIGLGTLRDRFLLPSDAWSTFYWPGLEHTGGQSDELFYDKVVQSLTVATWLERVLSGERVQVAP